MSDTLTKEEKRQRTNNQLLELTTADLMKQLATCPEARTLRAMAFQHWDAKQQREVQVHVMLVMDPADFLEPFQTMETI